MNEKEKMSGNRKSGGEGHRSPYLSHAKRALYHLSYTPVLKEVSMITIWEKCIIYWFSQFFLILHYFLFSNSFFIFSQLFPCSILFMDSNIISNRLFVLFCISILITLKYLVIVRIFALFSNSLIIKRSLVMPRINKY